VMRVPERKLLAAMGRTEGVVDVEDLEPAGLHGGAKLINESCTRRTALCPHTKVRARLGAYPQRSQERRYVRSSDYWKRMASPVMSSCRAANRRSPAPAGGDTMFVSARCR
jgi:hypothetical protein